MEERGRRKGEEGMEEKEGGGKSGEKGEEGKTENKGEQSGQPSTTSDPQCFDLL